MKVSAHFDSSEFESHDGAQSPFPKVVKIELLNYLEAIRTEYGRPIIVNSGYRSPEHNAKIGGVPNSLHCQGLAADIRPQNPRDLARLQKIAQKVVRCGGVGLYDNFLHVDARGQSARWDYRAKE